VLFDAFSPSDLEILPGETVQWTNVSVRLHTVTSSPGGFDSGDLLGGAVFEHRFDATGPFAYHCTVHPNMTGTVDVRPVILDPIPPAPVPAGDQVRLTGRSSETRGPVTIERDTGSGFRAVATAVPGADGAWTASVAAVMTADYRATAGRDASATRRLLVTDRRLHVRATRRGLRVTVSPALPNAVVLLELRLRERFGWWPTRRARLDYLSRADFVVRRRARARVVLVDRDGWTPIVTSATVRVGRRSP
jgi:hypothetical protein